MKPKNEIYELTENLFNTVREPLLVLDKDLNVINANLSFYKSFKVTLNQTIGAYIYDLRNHHWEFPKLKELLEKILPEKQFVDNYEVGQDFTELGIRLMLLNDQQIENAREEVI